MKTKVLYISYDGMTDPLGQSQVLPYLKKLSISYEIHLISAEKEENYKKHEHVISTICKDANISWHPLMYTKTPPVLSTIKDIRKLKKLAFDLHSAHYFQIIHCRSYISALIGQEMKKKYGTKFLFDMRGFWADERVDGNIWNLKIPVFKWIYKFFKKKEIEFLKEADYTISLTQAGKDEIYSWEAFKSNKPKIQIIPCCADLDFFNPNNINENLQAKFKSELNISNGDYVITYLGSIGTWYMLDEMLDFYTVLRTQKQNSKFLFISKDSPDTIRSKAKIKGIPLEEIIIRPAERSELPSLVSVSDVSIFFILPAYSKKASSPTKQAELFGLGIPIICNDNVGDTGPIVKENKAGLVISEFNTIEYEKIVNQLYKIEKIDAKHLKQVANGYASLDLASEKYLNIYDMLID